MNVSARHSYWLLCLAIVAGCQSAEVQAPPTTAAVNTPSPSVPAPPKGPRAASTTPASGSSKVTAAQITEFKPPFPERDLFDPPKRAQGTVRRDDEHGQTVELKGFINVDQPRVLLSIDGVISSIPEGGEKFGVHVISIKPPTAILQRGRNRWPATLE